MAIIPRFHLRTVWRPYDVVEITGVQNVVHKLLQLASIIYCEISGHHFTTQYIELFYIFHQIQFNKLSGIYAH